MRIAVSVILIFLSIPVFLLGILSASIKFELLKPSFWETTFEKNNVYNSLTDITKQSIVEQTVSQGGTPSGIRVITDVITVGNVKDFVNRNLENILNFANGKAYTLMLYIPVSRFPKGLLPKNFVNLPENIPIFELMTKLDIKGITQTQISYISLAGRMSTYMLLLTWALFAILIAPLFLMTGRGARFIGPGAALLLDGLASLSFYFYILQLRSGIGLVFAQKSDIAEKVLGTVASPLIYETVKIWLIAGIFAVFIGAILFFIKRPLQVKKNSGLQNP